MFVRILCLIVSLCGNVIVTQADDEGPRDLQGRGFTGITLERGNEFPIVCWIYPNSPAQREGTIRAGDRILSVRENSAPSVATSTKGMSVGELQTRLQGEPGSWIEIRVARQTVQGQEEHRVARLEREAMITLTLPDATSTCGFFNPSAGNPADPWPLPHIEDSSKLRHVSDEEWSRVTNGMPGEHLMRAVGEPLAIKPGRHPDEILWQYGWAFRADGVPARIGGVEVVVQPDTPKAANVFLTNGVVAESFTIEPGGRGLVEVLSRGRLERK